MHIITFPLALSFGLVLVRQYVGATPIDSSHLGLKFEKRATMPTLTLPYATYQATSYNADDDIYKFSNIRFAAPPLGNLRWQKPAAPLQETGINNGSVGFQCPQALPGAFLPDLTNPLLNSFEPVSEDCLFLDVLVPGAAVRGTAKNLPVLFWIFGGGYVLGSKSFFLYDGTPYVKKSGNTIIWVAPNYRLGAFGFLGGPTVSANGVANAAFYDQRAALQWVQSYIGFLGGDKATVTAMGESAGGGSIMHHLVSNRGTQNPLFKRAVIQSPAFEPLFDPVGLDKQYADFEFAAGCAGKGLACLRAASSATLIAANAARVKAAPYGTFQFGPTVDGVLIHQLPGIEIKAGNYWKDMSIITSHVSAEGILFSDPSITSEAQVDALLAQNFPTASTATIAQIKSLYPSPGLLKQYLTQFARLVGLIGEYAVTCNVRALVEGYAGKAYTYQFDFLPGAAIHGTDLLLTFFRTNLDISLFDVNFSLSFPTTKNVATGVQSWITSFARVGNPNTYRESGLLQPTIDLPITTIGSTLSNVVNVQFLTMSKISDPDTPKDRCDFWNGASWQGVTLGKIKRGGIVSKRAWKRDEEVVERRAPLVA